MGEISPKASEQIQKVLKSPTDNFVALVQVAGLDPRFDLRHKRFHKANFASCDLAGFDFTGAFFSRCLFADAKAGDTIFDGAEFIDCDVGSAEEIGTRALLPRLAAHYSESTGHTANVRVSASNTTLPAGFTQRATAQIAEMTQRYFSNALNTYVTIRPARAGVFHCDVVCHAVAGLVLKGSAEATGADLALRDAVSRIEKQFHRYMARLQQRKIGPSSRKAGLGTTVVRHYSALKTGADAGYTIFAPSLDDESEIETPVIVAETRVEIPEASVSDAVMMLDLRNTNALLFLNAGTSAYNMVYRRADGTIAWVEPSGR